MAITADQFPLKVKFKFIALAPRMFVRSQSGADVCYVSQKVLKLKEDIQIFADDTRTDELYRIKADRIVDFGANYAFSDSKTGAALGSVRSKAWRSIWKSTYEVVNTKAELTHRIEEDNPWVKVGNAILGELPVVGMFTGYFLNPKYSANDATTGNAVMQLVKEPSFFESQFTLHLLDRDLPPETVHRLTLSFLLMVQFMRSRG